MTKQAVFPYAIVPSGVALLPDLTGLRGAAVLSVAAGDLTALASDLTPFEPGRDDLLAHHRVVEAACDAGPALPVRFGTRFPDARALAGSLQARHVSLAAALQRIGRRREIAISLEWLDAPALRPESTRDGEEGPGRRFLEQRAVLIALEDRRRARAEALAQPVVDALAAAGVDRADAKLRIVPAARVALSCAVLTDAAQAGDAMRRVREAAAGWVDVRLHLAGPWPPYSFSESG